MPGVLPLPKDDYLAAHIPGAVFFDVDAVSDHSTRCRTCIRRRTVRRDVGARHFQ
jgi:3-mercaptopyruvate sulfurtransferase SseA